MVLSIIIFEKKEYTVVIFTLVASYSLSKLNGINFSLQFVQKKIIPNDNALQCYNYFFLHNYVATATTAEIPNM